MARQFSTTWAKRASSRLVLGLLAREQRDLLGVLAHANEVEAEIGFIALLVEIELDQRPADEVGEQGAEHGIEQRRPHEVAWNPPLTAEQDQGRIRRQVPEDDDERAERDDRGQHADADRERAVDEDLQVVGDALVGIVGDVAEQLHAIVIAALEPLAEKLHRHPPPPADLQPLIEVELVDGDENVEHREDAEIQELADEAVPVAILQGVVEAVVPFVEQHVDADLAELGGDHRGEQQASRPAVLGAKIGNGQPPDGDERRNEAFREHPRCPRCRPRRPAGWRA